MGELGWSKDRWKDSTLEEFNYAVGGYWRNWERFIGIPMREICFVQIAGNPNIKQSAKPRSVQAYMKLSIDKDTGKALITKEQYEELLEFRKKVVWHSRKN